MSRVGALGGRPEAFCHRLAPAGQGHSQVLCCDCDSVPGHSDCFQRTAQTNGSLLQLVALQRLTACLYEGAGRDGRNSDWGLELSTRPSTLDGKSIGRDAVDVSYQVVQSLSFAAVREIGRALQDVIL